MKINQRLFFSAVMVVGIVLLMMKFSLGCGNATKPFIEEPAVLSTSPADQATGVDLSAEVKAVFNKAIQSSSINAQTFTLSSNNHPVSGVVTYDGSTKTAVFTPSTNFSFSTVYTANISAEIVDVDGKNLTHPDSWTFTTAFPNGNLDSAFTDGNHSGYVIENYQSQDIGRALATDPAGNIYVAGWTAAPPVNINENGVTQMILWKILSSGQLDNTFGNHSGFLVEPGNLNLAEAIGLLRHSNGNLIVFGKNQISSNESDAKLWAYDPNTGAKISNFSFSGINMGLSGYSKSIAEDPSGKILLTFNTTSNIGAGDLVIYRLNSDGSTDQSFNNSNPVIFNSGGYNNDYGSGIAADGSGNIFVGGTIQFAAGTMPFSVSSAAIWKFDNQGNLVTGFGSQSGYGYLRDTVTNRYDRGNTIVLLPSGKILMTGYIAQDWNSPQHMFLARFNDNGSMDTSFGDGRTSGYVYEDITSEGYDLTVDSAGKILVVGDIQRPKLYNGVMINENGTAIWRFNADGPPDTAFGSGGKITSFIDTDKGFSLTLDYAGRILATGSTGDYLVGTDMITWRYK